MYIHQTLHQKKLKGWLARLLCKHYYIYLGKHTRIKYIFSEDWYYHTVEMYQCNKCGKVKKKVRIGNKL